MDWGSIIGGIGIGGVASSLLTQYLNAKMNKDDRVFKKKETAYTGYFDALYESEIDPSSKNALKVGYWANLISLVGSPEVFECTKTMNDTNDNLEARKKVLKRLKEAMRTDLGIDKRNIQ